MQTQPGVFNSVTCERVRNLHSGIELFESVQALLERVDTLECALGVSKKPPPKKAVPCFDVRAAPVDFETKAVHVAEFEPPQPRIFVDE